MHSFAASLLDLIPNLAFVTTRATRTGFICDVISPTPITAEHLKVAHSIAPKKCFHINEMLSTVATDFLRSRKQVLRSKQIDRDEQFVTVYFNETYANFGEEIEIDSYSVQNEGDVDTAIFHGKPVAVTRLRAVKKEYQKKIKIDHLTAKEYFRVEKDQIVWLPQGLKLREEVIKELCALFEGYQRVHRPLSEENPGKGEFDIVEVTGDPQGEFGLKDRFSHLLVRVGVTDRNSLLQLKEKLCKLSYFIYEDDLGLKWELVESEEGILKIWVDRLIAMLLEKDLVGRTFESK